MFLHTFNTWLIANLLHPLMIIAFGFMVYGHHGVLFYADVAKGFILVLGCSLLCSLPSLLIGWFLLNIIAPSDFTPFARFAIWIFCSCVLVLAEVLMIALIIDEPINLGTFSLAIPGALAVSAAIIIRHRQFQHLVYSLQINEHENDLV